MLPSEYGGCGASYKCNNTSFNLSLNKLHINVTTKSKLFFLIVISLVILIIYFNPNIQYKNNLCRFCMTFYTLSVCASYKRDSEPKQTSTT